MVSKSLAILGTRGIPARHGGFETFAEHLACYLVGNGWQVTVYCQQDGGQPLSEDTWRGVRLVNIPVKQTGPLGTIVFDWKSIRHSLGDKGVFLTLGYGTAIFGLLYKLWRKKNLVNMDGLEWQRAKWSLPAKIWLYMNERAGCYLADHLIADHPEIMIHLETRVSDEKITMIPYGADRIEQADEAVLDNYGLKPGGYALVIARPEPENSLYEIVAAFSSKRRNCSLVVVGHYEKSNKYHNKVVAAASDEVLFVGAIYEQETITAFRYFSRLYIHGHQVGGTNPSLVESLATGSPVLAHNNRFNRWVAGDGAAYFSDVSTCSDEIDRVLDVDEILEKMQKCSRKRHAEKFTWEMILCSYEKLLSAFI